MLENEINSGNFFIEETKNLLKLPIKHDNIKYLLKIIPSKDNISLIFKLEKEKIQTYYYYAKYDLDDFKHLNKKFAQETNIKGIYHKVKDIINNQTCKLEKNGLKYDINFIKKNKETTAIFTLRKKIVAQDRLNDLLLLQIQENKAKIKVLKKQITKLDKMNQNKNKVIENINSDILNLYEVANNLNTKILSGVESNNTKITPSKENDDEIKKTYPINKEENELLKKNLTLTQEKKQPEPPDNTIGKRYVSNNRKKKNKPKKIKNGNSQNKEENKNNNKTNNEDTLFCLDNDVYKNKKAYESLILFNFVCIIIVMYLLCSIYALKSNLTFEKLKDQELMKKVTLLSLFDDGSDDELGGIRENIVDFNLKNDDSENGSDATSGNKNDKKLRIKYIKTKMRENKEISLLKDEKDRRYFKKDIRKKTHRRVRDVKFELKYNSVEEYKYHNFYNNYRDMNEILLLFTNKKGKKFGIFSNNLIFYQKKHDNKDCSYSGYIYKGERYYEMNLKEFMQSYGAYIQSILDYLKNEHLRIKKKSQSSSFASKQLLTDVEMFEIYEVKYIRNP